MPTFKNKILSHKQCLKTISTVQWKNINLTSNVSYEDYFYYEANNFIMKPLPIVGAQQKMDSPAENQSFWD